MSKQPRHHHGRREQGHHRKREDMRDRTPRYPREQERWEGQPQGGYHGGGFPEGMGPLQGDQFGYATQPQPVRRPQDYQPQQGPSYGPVGYATQPQPVRRPQDYQPQQGPSYGPVGYATQPNPRYQQQEVPPSQSQVTVSGPGYDQRGGYPSHSETPQQQGNYPPNLQDAYRNPGYQQQLGRYPSHGQARPGGSGYQQQQSEYTAQLQDRSAGTGYQQQQSEYPAQVQERSAGSGYQQQQSEYPAQLQDGYHDPGYQHYPGETRQTDITIQLDGPGQYRSEQDHRRMEEDMARGNGELYGADSQKDKHKSGQGKWFSQPSKHHRKNRHSSPADMLEEDEKHPIRQRRVMSDRHCKQRKRKSGQAPVVVNPMGLRLRRCMADFDFDAFAAQLNEEELKEFQPHQPVIPEPDYSDEEEEEQEEEEQEGEENVRVEEEKEEEQERHTEEHEDEEQGRKVSDVSVDWVKDETIVERDARPAATVEKSRPKSKKKILRREFAKEIVGSMKDEDGMKGSAAKKLSNYELFKLETSKKWRKTKVQLWETLQWLVVWKGSFKEIEGQHGSSTTSYFSVLRWLMFLNLFVTVVIVGAIVLPQVFFQPDSFSETFSNNTSLTGFQNTAKNCSNFYQENEIKQENVAEKVLAVIQGSGWMERTVLFAGFYFNKTYQLIDEEQRSYNMPLAFLFTTAVYFFITLILMILYTGDGVKEQLLTSGEQYNYFNKVFSAWDYTLMQKKAADQKQQDLLRGYKNELKQIEEKKRRQNMSAVAKARVYIARICVNLLVLAFWAGAGFLIYMVVVQWSKQLLAYEKVNKSDLLKLVVDFLPSLTISVLNVFIPTLFYMVVKVEDLTPDTEVEITVARSVVLRLASVVVLVVSLQTKISACREDTTDNSSLKCHNCKEIRCWETYVGGQFYKLVVMDFFVTVITTIVEFIRRIVADSLSKKSSPENPEENKEKSWPEKLVELNTFDLPKNVLDIVYSQTICWIGAFFCPLIPAITVVKFFLYFSMKKVTLLKNYKQSEEAYRASKTNTFFMAILLGSFVLCAIVMAYVIGRVHPSLSCGPWRVYSKEDYFMYVSVSDIVSTAPSIWRTILTFLTSWMFYVPMLIVMSLVIYYNVAVASGNKRIIALLKQQLAMEGMDKQFLLKEVHKAMKRGEALAK